MRKHLVTNVCACILAVCVIASACVVVPVVAMDDTSTVTTAVHCYATQLDYDDSPMAVGETRAIRFYHPATNTAAGASVDEVSENIAVSYEEGSDTVYVTALAEGSAKLYIRESKCAFGGYVYLTVAAATSSTTTTTKWYQATSAPSSYPYPEDINLDGFVNMMDVLELYSNVSTGQEIYTFVGPLGDMNADDIVNMMDVLLLYAHISGDYTFAV